MGQQRCARRRWQGNAVCAQLARHTSHRTDRLPSERKGARGVSPGSSWSSPPAAEDSLSPEAPPRSGSKKSPPLLRGCGGREEKALSSHEGDMWPHSQAPLTQHALTREHQERTPGTAGLLAAAVWGARSLSPRKESRPQSESRTEAGVGPAEPGTRRQEAAGRTERRQGHTGLGAPVRRH